jgi:hypothetical protein
MKVNWKFKFCILLIVALPAFSGLILEDFHQLAVAGLSWSWFLYFAGVHLILFVLMGIQRYGKISGIASLIMLPVVFSGASLSYLLWFLKEGQQTEVYRFGAHYLALCITMLTVIPLSLSMVAVLPFGAFEQRLLQRKYGVSPMEKQLLMVMRVFNHIVFDVIPDILEVLREESGHGADLEARRNNKKDCAFKKIARFLAGLTTMMIQIGVEGICTAMQYIPLWAVEIAQLPTRKKNKHQILIKEEGEKE